MRFGRDAAGSWSECGNAGPGSGWGMMSIAGEERAALTGTGSEARRDVVGEQAGGRHGPDDGRGRHD